MKLTNEEIARVFAMYFNNKVQWFNSSQDLDVLHVIWSYNDSIGEEIEPAISEYKLLLTPLSSITDEHAIDVGKMLGFNITETRPSFVAKSKGKIFVEYWLDN